MHSIIIKVIAISTASMALIGCNEPTKPDATKLSLEYPKGDESLNFGDTIPISYSANGDVISSVGLQVSSDNGQNYFHIRGSSVPTSGSGLKKYSCKWIIGKEDEYDIKLLYQDIEFGGAANPDPVWKCKLKIYDYSDNTNNAVSGDFTVKFTKPYYLRYPIGGETYKVTDSIPIIYTRRSDKSSVIERFFWSLQNTVWSQITTKRDLPARSKLTTEKKYFVPTDTTFIDPVGDSTMIMINDYSIKQPIQTGWIKITK